MRWPGRPAVWQQLAAVWRLAWLASGSLPAGGRLAVGSLAAGGWLARGWRLAVGSLALAGAGWCLEIGPLVRWQIRGRDRRGNERLRRETPGKPQGHPEKTPAPQTHRCLLYSRSMPSLQPVDVFFLCIIRRGPQAGHPRDPIRRDTLGTPQGLPEKTPAPHRCLLYSRSMPPLQPGDVFFCASFEEAPQAGHPRDITPGTSPQGSPQGPPEKTPAPHRCLLYSRAMSFFFLHSITPRPGPETASTLRACPGPWNPGRRPSSTGGRSRR